MSARSGSSRASRPTGTSSRTGPRPGSQPELVVGFDRDEASETALQVARDLARRLHAHLTVVHAVDLGDYPIDPDTPGWEDQAEVTLAEERARVQQALAGHRFGWSYETRHGEPADVLIQVAEERDALLIVVGRHEHGVSERLRRLIDGSVSHRLTNRCGRPVLVVPHDHGPYPAPQVPA
jgi:nucleotide-binding universal stress UspA family protein